jgi:predicted alpha/beta-hydrolase family hydrolase
MPAAMPTADGRLVNEPTGSPPAVVLLAHGAGAPMDSPFMDAMAGGLSACGWRVVRFEFPYMAGRRHGGPRRAPDRLPRLERAFCDQLQREALAHSPGLPLFIGGKSMGGRVASLVADRLAASHDLRGCLCLGYPFHPPGKPEALRTEHLQSQRTPTLILQGERDAFGRRAEVEGYGLAASVELSWIPSGDHSFKPTRSSGLGEAEAWGLAVQAADAFLRRRLLA